MEFNENYLRQPRATYRRETYVRKIYFWAWFSSPAAERASFCCGVREVVGSGF
jgi:hypothetical protein